MKLRGAPEHAHGRMIHVHVKIWWNLNPFYLYVVLVVVWEVVFPVLGLFELIVGWCLVRWGCWGLVL